jgi:IrrE N-terminal-like domain
MRDVEERAERVLASAPAYVWDGERLPVPIEDIVDSVYGLLVRDVEDMRAAPGAPPLAEGQSLSGLLFPSRGEIWVNAEEARQWPPRRRFTIGHELGHWVMHRTGQQALFCRRTSVDEQATPPGRDIEEEASAFAAGLLMPQWLFVREHARCRGDVAELGRAFGTSEAATKRRVQALFGD